MLLQAGTRLGPYAITALVGEGGMGEVYRAIDTRLDRVVALKRIKGQFSGRFEREARAISALNHPNICSLYDIGTENDSGFLVMEFIEGQPVRGPMPIEQALSLASQIAAALDAAHRQGIVHRDLKPANILLAKDGVKLLDFGIAKQQRAVEPVHRRTDSETITEEGAIVGTLHYMSPEQLEGREADARSDIFSLGCVLYEMLTGKRAFEGGSRASVIAAVMTAKPMPVSHLQPLATPPLDRLVRKCLAKDPDDRWQTARDLRDELLWIAESPEMTQPAIRRRSRWMLGLAILGGFALAIAPAGWMYWTQPPPGRGEPTRFQIYPPDNHEFSTSLATVSTPEMAISPNGRNLVFTAIGGNGRSALWVRPLHQSTAHPLPDTDDAAYPFWSPDSRSIGFFAQGKVKRISVESGVPQDICDIEANSWGGAWLPNDTILLSMGSGQIMRVSAAGGRPTPVTDAAQDEGGEGIHRWPALLPDGRHFLYFSRGRNSDRRGGVDVGSVDDRRFERRVLETRHRAIFSPPDWLLYLDSQNLMARRYDLDRFEPVEEPVLVAGQIGGSTTSYTSVSSSDNGILAFAGAIKYRGKLTWFNRDGRTLSAIEPSGDYADLSISPDGNRVALTRPDPRTGSPDIWLYDIARETMSRFTLDTGLDASSVWSRDGRRLVYRSNRTGLTSLYRSDIADSSKPEVILDWRGAPILPGQLGHFNAVPCDITPDGKTLVFVVGNRGFDLWLLPLEGDDRKPRPYQTTPFGEIHAAVSPDGRWLAYASDETGRFEVYVRSFPDAGSKFQISTAGGWEPRWRGDGRELYYLAPERRLMAVPVDSGNPPRFGIAQAMFSVRTRLTPHPYRRNYAVDKDGEQFLVNTLSEDGPRPSIEVVLNWQASLSKANR